MLSPSLHRTTVWAQLFVQAGSVRYVDLEGASPRDVRLGPGDSAVIVPGVEHQVEPSNDATFFVQFYREPDAAMVPGPVAVDHRRRSGPGNTEDAIWTRPRRSSRW